MWRAIKQFADFDGLGTWSWTTAWEAAWAMSWAAGHGVDLRDRKQRKDAS
jgi:hypothetical protein